MTAVWLLSATLVSEVVLAASSSPTDTTEDGSCTRSCLPSPPEHVEPSTQGSRRCLLQSLQDIGVGEYEEDALVDRGFVDSPKAETPAWRNTSSQLVDDAHGLTREAVDRLRSLDATADAVPIAAPALVRLTSARSTPTISTIQGGRGLPTMASWRPNATSDAVDSVGADARLLREQVRKMVAQLVGRVLVTRQEVVARLERSGVRSPDAILALIVVITIAFVIGILLLIFRADQAGNMYRWPSSMHRESSPARGQATRLTNDGLATSSPPHSHVNGGSPWIRDRPLSDRVPKVQLCPGLVVPHGSECLLAVPTLESCGLPSKGDVDFVVRDLHGTQVIQATVHKPDWTRGERCTILVIRAASASWKGDQPPVLAYCQAGPFMGARRSVMIQDGKQEAYASLAQDPSRAYYALSYVAGGPMVYCEGDFANHAVSLTDESQEPLADTEPFHVTFDSARTYYKLRVCSRADVGLVLCCLVSMQLMEMS